MNPSKPSTITPELVATKITAPLTIEGITLTPILRYFETLNASDYGATATLFAEDGILNAPFESAIVGPEAIATYLQAEATGMQLLPRQGIVEPLAEGYTQVQVSGKVQTAWFGVNVSWLFVLNPQQKIAAATIKLLASPQELLNMRG